MDTWTEARSRVLRQLDEVREQIAARDDGSVLGLINQQDAFCELARKEQQASGAASDEPTCSFCEGYKQGGGCLDRLDQLNKAVLVYLQREQFQDSLLLL